MITNNQDEQAPLKVLSYGELNQLAQPQLKLDLMQMLQDTISTDSQGIFANAYIHNRTDASFKQIAIAKLSGQSWKEISQRLDLPNSTLISFYRRWCYRFAPILKTEIEKYLA